MLRKLCVYLMAVCIMTTACNKPAETPTASGPPTAWSNVKAGMNRGQIEEITGDSPTKEGMVKVNGQDMEELVWVQGAHSLTVRGRNGVTETVEIK
jgi:hypothetical protein